MTRRNPRLAQLLVPPGRPGLRPARTRGLRPAPTRGQGPDRRAGGDRARRALGRRRPRQGLDPNWQGLDPNGHGRNPNWTPRHGRRLRRLVAGAGAGVVLGFLGATGFPELAVVAVLAVTAWPVSMWAVRRRATARRLAVRRASAPAVLDLLGAALLAGLNPHKAVLRVADRAPEPLEEDLELSAAVLRLGGTPSAALHAAAERSGLDELRAAAAALDAAERWGAPPAEALAARAEALRSRARLQAEAEAGRAAVRLAFPLVLCFLPAFVLLTVVPTVAGAVRALTP
jgi:Flp pilus assembly protein TadB